MRKPNIRTRIARALLSTPIGKEIRAQLATKEDDNTFYPGGSLSGLYRDRFDWDRQKVLAECLRAWRVNPLARRIVRLIKQFVIGEGLSIGSPPENVIESMWSI